MLFNCSVKKVHTDNDWVYTAYSKQLLLTLNKEITVFCSAFSYLTEAKLLTELLFKYKWFYKVKSYW